MAKLAMKSGFVLFSLQVSFLIMKKEKIRKEVNYAGSDSYKCDPFRTDRDLALLLIMVLILVQIYDRQKKSIKN